MYNWLTKNILFVHLVVLTAAAGWIQGGTRSDLLYPVLPWLTLLVFECLLFFPQAKESESLLESRERVWRNLLREPLTWISLLLLIVLLIPLVNVTPAPYVHAKTGKWITTPAPYPWLPFCSDSTLHASTLLWFPPGLVAMLAAKHGLLKKSKRLLFEMICWIGVSLSILGFMQLATGTHAILWINPQPQFFSTFGYTNLAGAYFTMMAALSFGLWMQQAGEHKGMILFPTSEHGNETSFIVANRMIVACLINLAGAIASVSRAAILFCSIMMIVMGLYGLCFVWQRVNKPMKWLLAASVLGVIVTAAALIVAFPVKQLQHEVENISTSAVLERVTNVKGQNSRVATEIFVTYPLYGVGGRHYSLYRPQFWKGDYKKTGFDCACSNAHNDIYQFMAEYGLVGFGLMVTVLVLLTGSMVYSVIRMMFAQRLHVPMAVLDKGSTPFYRIPPPTVAVFVATVILITHAYGDVVLRTPAVIIVWLLALTCVSGWFPVFKKAKS